MESTELTNKPVKLKIDGQKYKGTITRVDVDVEEVDVTQSGLFGGPVDTFRRTVPGRRTRTLTIVLDEN